MNPTPVYLTPVQASDINSALGALASATHLSTGIDDPGGDLTILLRHLRAHRKVALAARAALDAGRLPPKAKPSTASPSSPNTRSHHVTLTGREVSTILAALRLWERQNWTQTFADGTSNPPDDPTDDSDIDPAPILPTAVQDLCERIDFGDPAPNEAVDTIETLSSYLAVTLDHIRAECGVRTALPAWYADAKECLRLADDPPVD